MNILLLIIACLVFVASIFWLKTKKGVWERRIGVLTALASLVIAIWQLIAKPKESLSSTIRVDNNSQSPVTGNIDTQINNYYSEPENRDESENSQTSLYNTTKPLTNSKTSKLKQQKEAEFKPDDKIKDHQKDSREIHTQLYIEEMKGGTIINQNLDVPEPKFVWNYIKKNFATEDGYLTELELDIVNKGALAMFYLEVRGKEIVDFSLRPKRSGVNQFVFGAYGDSISFRKIENAYGKNLVTIKAKRPQEFQFFYDYHQ